VALERLREHCGAALGGEEFYARVRARGIDFGPSFQTVREIARCDGTALASLAAPPTNGTGRPHPTVVDACFQVLGALVEDESDERAYVPVRIERLELGGNPAAWCRATATRSDTAGALTGDVELLDDEGGIVGRATGVELRALPREALTASQPSGPAVYEVGWRPAPLEPGTNGAGPGTWLVLGGGETDALARELTVLGAAAIRPAADAAGPSAAVASALSGDEQVRGVVYVADGAPAGDPPTAALEGTATVLELVQTLSEQSAPPRLWIVTHGAQPAGDGLEHPDQSPLWGLRRVAALEHPKLRATCADVDGDDRSWAALARELVAGGDEPELALRGAERLVPRLVPARDSGPERTPDETPVALDIQRRGVLDDLVLCPAERRPPGPGEIEIRVHASGLNFRDVLNALGMYPGEPPPLGGECAGRIVAVGEGVEDLAVGDEVAAIAPAAFATYATTDARLAMRIPAETSAAEAAGLPIAFLTAWYGLERLAGMSRGDRVLIHAATGGVGLAAVRLARRAGAEVFATAGSDEKRSLLRSLGIEHVMDSRTLAFADEVRAKTGGEGVDIVLNSLAGDAVTESLGTLRAGGIFVELGKADLLDEERVAELDVAYHAFDLAELCMRDPDLVAEGLALLHAALTGGELTALPTRALPLTDAAGAFRHVAQAKHVGKVVLVQDEASGALLDPDATYLITGGHGALGRAVAGWMLDNGSRHVVLAGRNAGASDDLPAGVVSMRADVSDERDVRALLDEIAASLPPLRGVVHAAGVLDDGVLAHQTHDRLATALAPKAAGAWNLHRLTGGLDFFVLFSSVAGVLGSPGQGNYAAANAFLDGLAHLRRGMGEPATSIAWGPWEGPGMGAGATAGRGIAPLPVDYALDTLGRVLRDGPANPVVVDAEWARLGEAPPILSELVTGGGADTSARATLVEELQRLAPAHRREELVQRIAVDAARVLDLDGPASVDVRRPLGELGLDSLTGLELSNMIGRMTGIEFPATLLFDYPTVDAVAGHVLAELLPDDAAVAPAGDEGSERALDEIERLSDEEAEGLIERSLSALVEGDG
jgi:NADPH:quinone reductase-like Zn-dependent oxidoreductase/acyl carrier protein